jgi:hypothetical protein
MLLSIASVVQETGEMVDQLTALLSQLVEAISATDDELSHSIFLVTFIYISGSAFDESLAELAITFARQSLFFAISAVGKECEECLDYLHWALVALEHWADAATNKSIVQLVESMMNEIPIENICVIVGAIDCSSFSKWCFSEVTERNIVIVLYLVAKTERFAAKHSNQVKAFVMEAMKKEDPKLAPKIADLIMCFVASGISARPLFPSGHGIAPVTPDSVQWIVPTEETAAEAVAIADELLAVIKTLYARDDHQTRKQAAHFICGIVAGLHTGSSSRYWDPGPMPVELPPLADFAFENVSHKLREIIRWVFTVAEKEQHPSVIVAFIRAFQECLTAVDHTTGTGCGAPSFVSSLTHYTKLSLMKPPLEALYAVHHFWIAGELYGIWQGMKPTAFHGLARETTQFVFRWAISPDPEVRVALTQYLTLFAAFPVEFTTFIPSPVPLFNQAFEQSVEALATVAEVYALFCANLYRSFPMLVDLALILARPLPGDVPNDALKTLRTTVVSSLMNSRGLRAGWGTEATVAERRRLVQGLIETSGNFNPGSDTDRFISSLIAIAVDSLSLFLGPDVAQYLASHLLVDDMDVRLFCTQGLTLLIEGLIPRDRLDSVEYPPVDDEPNPPEDDSFLAIAASRFSGTDWHTPTESVNPSNYDSLQYRDAALPAKKHHVSRLMTREESLDEAFLAKYFPDPAERIATHVVLYKIFGDDFSFLNELFAAFKNEPADADAGLHDERVKLWCSCVRFFGPKCAIRMLEIGQEKLKSAEPTDLSLAAEIAGGVVWATKYGGWARVVAIKDKLFEFLTAALCDAETDAATSWSTHLSVIFDSADPRRYFWLFDFLKTMKPVDSAKALRQQVHINRLMGQLGWHDLNRMREIYPKCVEPLFDSRSLDLDLSRMSVIDFLRDWFRMTIGGEWVDLKSELFYDYIIPAADTFIVRWVAAVCENHDLVSISAMPICIDAIEDWVQLAENRDEDEELVTEDALTRLVSANIVTSCAVLPVTMETAQPPIRRTIEQLNTTGKSWQTQTRVFGCLEIFLANSYFFVEDETLNLIVNDYVLPALLHSNSDVQQSADNLLGFIFRNFAWGRARIPEYAALFGERLKNEALSERLAGARGLIAVIEAESIFDEVPSYIVDAFALLADAAECESAVAECVQDFFSVFWSNLSNYTENVVLLLAPFRGCCAPSYIT